MISKDFTYAIVGASNNPEKYGYRIMKDLIEGGYKVIPINPKELEIFGHKVYPTLSNVPEKIDVVDIVVPPQVTEQIVREVKDLGIKNVWMQPGAESDEAIKFCEENGINCVHHACIMVERKKEN